MCMNSAVINIKTHPQTKKQAQQIAQELGISVSSLVNGFLKHLIRTKTVTFSTAEEPSDYMIKALEESAADIKAGRVISFDSGEKALAYLQKIAYGKRTKKN